MRHVGPILFLIALFVSFAIRAYRADARYHGWVLGDWLISYSAGFTRRGLPGQFLLGLSDATSIPAWLLTLVVQLLFYAAFLVGFGKLIRHQRLPVWFLLLACSPAALLFMVNEPDAVGRKEIIYLAALSWYLIAIQRGSTASRPAFLCVAAATGALATLSHELFFFYVPYFFGAALLQPESARDRVSAACIAAGSLAAMALVVLFGGDIHGAAACNGLLARGFPPAVCDGVLAWGTSTVTGALTDTLVTVRTLNYGVVYGTAFALAALPFGVYFVCPEDSRSISGRAFAAFVVVALLFSSPLFLTAIDWGRFLSIHAVSLTMLGTMLLPRSDANGRDSIAPHRWTSIGVLTVAVYAGSWSMPNCCSATLSAGLVESSLRVTREWIQSW